MGPAPLGGSCEGGSFHTLRSPFTGGDGGGREGNFRATEGSTATGVQKVKWRDSCTEDWCWPSLTSLRCCLLLTHPWQPAQHATARVLSSRDNFPGRIHSEPQAVAMSCQTLLPQACPAFQLWLLCPFLSPGWVSKGALISCCFNPLLSGQGTDAWGQPPARGGAKIKAEAQGLWKQRKEREISLCSLRSSRSNPHINFINTTSVEYLNRKRKFPKLRWWTLGAIVELGFAFCVWFVFAFMFMFMFILVYFSVLVIIGGFVYWFGCSFPFFNLLFLKF